MIKSCLLVLAFPLIISGCGMYPVIPDGFDIDSPMELMHWIHERVEYQDDDYINYWKSPREILDSGRGDCEDFCILFASMAHELWGWEPEMRLVYLHGSWFHYFLAWDGMIYDPTLRFICQEYPADYSLIDRIDYDVYIWWSTAGYTKNINTQYRRLFMPEIMTINGKQYKKVYDFKGAPCYACAFGPSRFTNKTTYEGSLACTRDGRGCLDGEYIYKEIKE